MISEQVTRGPVFEGPQTGGETGLNVVLGAENPLGWALTEELATESKEVRAVFFRPVKGDHGLPQVQKIGIDPLKAGSVVDACQGAGTIYDCYEPSYGSKKEVWTQITSNGLLAAIEISAPLVFASHLL